MSSYTVQAGDTLASIASRELGDPLAWFDILQANPQIKNPDLIYPGQVLNVPARPVEIRAALAAVLDAVDYTAGACSPIEMVGAVLPVDLIRLARQALRLVRP